MPEQEDIELLREYSERNSEIAFARLVDRSCSTSRRHAIATNYDEFRLICELIKN
jgi:hypothetical protein